MTEIRYLFAKMIDPLVYFFGGVFAPIGELSSHCPGIANHAGNARLGLSAGPGGRLFEKERPGLHLIARLGGLFFRPTLFRFHLMRLRQRAVGACEGVIALA